MKKRLSVFFIFFSFAATAQIPYNDTITFDAPYLGFDALVHIDTTNYHHNIWQIGPPHKTVFTSAYSAPNVIVTDTANPYPVNDTSVFIINIPGNKYSVFPVYSFNFYYQLDKDSGSIAKFEYSGDSGIHWLNLLDTLPQDWTWLGVHPNFDTNTSGWTPVNLYYSWVSGLLPDTLLFRFTFISDSVFANKDGWEMDNFIINYWWEGLASQVKNNKSTTLYPNPTNDELTINITATLPYTISIINTTGQTIQKLQTDKQQQTIDVSRMPAGVYNVCITGSDGGRVNNKIVVVH